MSITSRRRAAPLAIFVLTLAAFGAASVAEAQGRLSAQARGEARSIAQSCRAEAKSLCQGVKPGGGRVLLCLDQNAQQLSPNCAAAVANAPTLRAEITQ